jgi:hypothetical protein
MHNDSIIFDIGSWIRIYALLAAAKAKQVIVPEINPDIIVRVFKQSTQYLYQVGYRYATKRYTSKLQSGNPSTCKERVLGSNPFILAHRYVYSPFFKGESVAFP